jgi:hypothetical protein
MHRFVASLIAALILGGLLLLIWRLRPAVARRLWLVCFTLIVSGGATMMVTSSFLMRWGLRTQTQRDGLFAMVDGTAFRPFVFRRLALDLVKLGTSLVERLPRSAVDGFVAKSNLLAQIYPGVVLTRHEQIELHVGAFLVWAAWLGSVLAGAGLLRAFRDCSWLEGIATATLAICLIPLTFSNGGYIYDAFELLLWTSALVCAVQGPRPLLALLIIAALVNKESTLAVLPALFPLLARRFGARSSAAWVGSLMLIGLIWLRYVRAKYAVLPGDAQLWALPENWAFWSKPSSYFRVAPLFAPGLLAPRGGNLATLFLLLVPLRFGWAALRQDAKWALLLTVGITLPLFLVSGCLDETRALAPIFPFLLLAGSEGARALAASRTASEASQPAP